jgi:hypothetical protein
MNHHNFVASKALVANMGIFMYGCGPTTDEDEIRDTVEKLCDMVEELGEEKRFRTELDRSVANQLCMLAKECSSIVDKLSVHISFSKARGRRCNCGSRLEVHRLTVDRLINSYDVGTHIISRDKEGLLRCIRTMPNDEGFLEAITAINRCIWSNSSTSLSAMEECSGEAQGKNRTHLFYCSDSTSDDETIYCD